jgi:opacity protein-like surface antigen
VHWTDWLRTTAGWRGDYFAASVDSVLQPANSGNPKEAIGSPKFRIVIGPFDKTEFFVGAGMGYHSNDARSTVVTEVPGSPTTPESPSPFLVRSRGVEVGVRSTAPPNLNSSVSLFYIHQDSELFFDGDTGDTTAGLPSQRTGVEFTNDYRLASWLHVDANLALSRARFLGTDQTQAALYQSLAGFPQAQIGNAPGDYVYNAPWMIASGGVTLGEKAGWFGALRWRFISSRPLTEDGVFQSPPMNVFNGTVGYRFENGWRVQIDALNLLNSSTDQSTYAYGSLLTTDTLFALCNPARGPSNIPAAVCQNGVMDYVYHPIEPLAIRLTLAGPLDTINVRAMSAEFERAVPAYQAPAADYDWTGFYIGAHVDDSWSKTGGSTVNTASGAASAAIIADTPNWHGGIQAGYDYMMPSRVVIGLSADVSSGGTRVNTASDASGVSANQTVVFDSEAVRARLGYAVDNFLFYGTGGWAWSNNQYIRTQLTGTLHQATAGTDEAVNTYLSGWTAGAGMAYAFAQSWNVFAEYRYTSYGSSTIALPFSQLSTTSTTGVSEVELGVNYKFNSGLPAAAGTLTEADLQSAASAPALATKAPHAAEVYNWSGCYIGGDGGYGWGRSNGTLMTAAGTALAPYSYDVTGPLSGLFIGGNYQINRFVAGVEGDWQRANLTGNNETQSPIGAAGSFPAGPYTIATTIKNSGAIRGRFGVAFNRFLVFGTGGWAWGNPSQSYALLGSAPFASTIGNAFGWTAGAGVDYAFNRDVFARIEYRHSNLGAQGFADAATNSADTANRLPIRDMRVGIAYKFNGDLIAD